MSAVADERDVATDRALEIIIDTFTAENVDPAVGASALMGLALRVLVGEGGLGVPDWKVLGMVDASLALIHANDERAARGETGE